MRGLILSLALLWPFASFADYSIQLNNIRVADLARIVFGDVLHKSFVLDDEVIQAQDAVTLNWVNVDAPRIDSMTRDLLRLRGFELQSSGGVVLVRKRTKTDDDLLVYQPLNRSAKYLSDVLANVAGVQQVGGRPVASSVPTQSALQNQSEVPASVSGQMDRAATDQLAYQCAPANCERLRKLLAQLDTPEAQVVLRAALYEVGTTKGEGSALQLVAHVLSAGNSDLSVSAGSVLSGSNQLGVIAGGLDAVVSLLDQDSRFKSVARPMLRVRSGALAKFSVGQSVPILGAATLDRNGNPVQSIEYKPSGTILTVQPDIRRDVIDLNITQELSSFVQTTTGVNNSPTLMQRTANSQLGIKPGEVVLFAGLEQQTESESNSRIFGFNVGKQSSEGTTQVLLFIEALRI